MNWQEQQQAQLIDPDYFDTPRFYLLRCDNLHARGMKTDEPYIVVRIDYPHTLEGEIEDLNARYPMEPITHYIEIEEPK